MDDRARALELTPVSRETAARLDEFVAFLLPWAEKTNLIARSTMPAIWTRHIADSLQLLPIVPDVRVWTDIGSGAGFPGIVVACVLTGRTNAHMHLVESNGKKATFLREAVKRLDLPATVHPVRIEDFVKNNPPQTGVVTARALAPLDHLLKLASPLLKPGVMGLFPKGQDVEAELTTASKSWKIEADLVPSKTNPSSRIVVVRSLAKRTGRS